MTATTTTGHDANGFPIALPYAVPFFLEESDEWVCSACDEDVSGDVDARGHRYDGPTARQIWTACPLEGDGNGDVFTGSFSDALAYFSESFGPAHVDYPHWPGRLYDCPACESACHCVAGELDRAYCEPCTRARRAR